MVYRNGKSYITNHELFGSCLDILNKLSLVLYSDEYYIDTKDFCRSVLDFAIDHEFITWKQANAIMNIKTTQERIRLYSNKRSKNVRIIKPFIYRTSKSTDRAVDNLTKLLFGECIHEEELEGYTLKYRDDGSRYFALPTTNDINIIDYI